MSTTTYNSTGMATRHQIARVAIYVMLVFAALVFLAPMLVMLMNSFKSDTEMYINLLGCRWSGPSSALRASSATKDSS